MEKPTFLPKSLKQLQKLTRATHSSETADVANALWEKHLQVKNPLWDYVTAKAFSVSSRKGSAHVMAMLDKRLPGLGLVGYFACSDSQHGTEALNQATAWLKKQPSIKDVYGPINGTAISDYRLNMNDDYWFPGEPVNPSFYSSAFKAAGFSEFNYYVSGIVEHYKLYARFFIKAPKNRPEISIRPFDINNQQKDLKKFHMLMTSIFPEQSIYCPTLSWDERVYNFKGKIPMFNPRYTYFLEDNEKPIGIIVSYACNGKLIIKTVGILAKYRGQNLSNILTHKVHKIASEDKLDAVIYAMVRVGNAAYKKKRPGLKIVRRYVTMKKSL